MTRRAKQQEQPSVGDLTAEGQRIAAAILATVAPLEPDHRAVAVVAIAGEAIRRLVAEEPACSIPIAARAMLAREERQC